MKPFPPLFRKYAESLKRFMLQFLIPLHPPFLSFLVPLLFLLLVSLLLSLSLEQQVWLLPLPLLLLLLLLPLHCLSLREMFTLL
jgi:hypothetical protein